MTGRRVILPNSVKKIST